MSVQVCAHMLCILSIRRVLFNQYESLMSFWLNKVRLLLHQGCCGESSTCSPPNHVTICDLPAKSLTPQHQPSATESPPSLSLSAVCSNQRPCTHLLIHSDTLIWITDSPHLQSLARVTLGDRHWGRLHAVCDQSFQQILETWMEGHISEAGVQYLSLMWRVTFIFWVKV